MVGWFAAYDFEDKIVGQKLPVSYYKNKKEDKDQERCNQAPHLTQETNGKVTTSQLDIKNESQEVRSFPAGDHKAPINRRARKHN